MGNPQGLFGSLLFPGELGQGDFGRLVQAEGNDLKPGTVYSRVWVWAFGL